MSLIKLHWKAEQEFLVRKKSIENENDKKETLAGDAFQGKVFS